MSTAERKPGLLRRWISRRSDVVLGILPIASICTCLSGLLMVLFLTGTWIGTYSGLGQLIPGVIAFAALTLTAAVFFESKKELRRRRRQGTREEGHLTPTSVTLVGAFLLISLFFFGFRIAQDVVGLAQATFSNHSNSVVLVQGWGTDNGARQVEKVFGKLNVQIDGTGKKLDNANARTCHKGTCKTTSETKMVITHPTFADQLAAFGPNLLGLIMRFIGLLVFFRVIIRSFGFSPFLQENIRDLRGLALLVLIWPIMASLIGIEAMHHLIAASHIQGVSVAFTPSLSAGVPFALGLFIIAAVLKRGNEFYEEVAATV